MVAATAREDGTIARVLNRAQAQSWLLRTQLVVHDWESFCVACECQQHCVPNRVPPRRWAGGWVVLMVSSLVVVVVVAF